MAGAGLAGLSASAGAALPALDQAIPAERLLPASVLVHAFRFEGHTVFTTPELERLTAPWVGRSVTWLELEQARTAVTQAYVSMGYINSGAVMVGPPGADGVVTLRLIEGRLTGVNVSGHRWLRPGFYRQRLDRVAGGRLNVHRLRDELQRWRDVYPIEQVNAELRPGAAPGTALLDVKVRERMPFHAGIQYANDRPPSTGAEQITALLRAETLSGRADPFTLDYVLVRGGERLQRAERPGGRDWAASYRMPIQAGDTALQLHYARSSAVVIEAPFDQLDITGKAEVGGLAIVRPLWREAQRELALTVAGEHKVSRTSLLGVPYSFSRGARDGEAATTALRISGQYVQRSAEQVLAARVTLSRGLDTGGATANASGPGAEFTSVLVQVQQGRRLGRTRSELVLRAAAQYSPDPLLTVEQLALGGQGTVRGYRENTLVRDTGVLVGAELRLAVWSPAEGQPYVQLVPFCEWGAGWNNGVATPAPRDLGSAGLGIVLRPIRQVEASLIWGYAFRRLTYLNRSRQDDGLHFRISLWAF